MYILPIKVSINTNLDRFQYKILNDILFLNKSLFKFKNVPSPLHSFCNSANETLLHTFYTCTIISAESVLFIFFNINNQQQNLLLIKYLLQTFVHYLCMSREHGSFCFTSFKLCLTKIKIIEQSISPCNSKKNGKC